MKRLVWRPCPQHWGFPTGVHFLPDNHQTWLKAVVFRALTDVLTKSSLERVTLFILQVMVLKLREVTGPLRGHVTMEEMKFGLKQRSLTGLSTMLLALSLYGLGLPPPPNFWRYCQGISG